jgi:hypothetical protein
VEKMKIAWNNGPKALGIPSRRSNMNEFSPSTFTQKDLLLSQTDISSMISMGKPILFSLFIRRFTFTALKAELRSKLDKRPYLSSSRALVIID